MATIKLKNFEIEKLMKAYEKFRVKNSNVNALAMYKFNGCTISVFKSGKVLFQGPKANVSAAKWGYKPAQKNIDSLDFKTYIGTDEVGTGDFFGPVIVAGVYINENLENKLKKLNVGDSKKIKDEKILKLAPKIMKIVKYEYSLISNEKYNKVIKNLNMNEIKAYLHNDVIIKLVKNVGKTNVIVDGFTSAKNYFKYLKNTKVVKNGVYLIQKAEEKYIAVAAASIIARYYFIKAMDKLSSIVKTKLHYGAGPMVDKQIKNFDHQSLYKIAKLNFKNYTKLK